MKLIERTKYLNKLKSVIGTPDIKVITGVRRSGKSKLLESFSKYLNENDKQANIIHINFNLKTSKNLSTEDVLYDYVEKKYIPNVNNFVLIDEVQMCSGFENAINWLHATEQYDIYITGSNAFLSSSDLATLFTGRTFEIMIYPFSFEEYLEYFDHKNISEAFDKYVRDGGMSGSYVYENQQDRYEYIEKVFNTLIVRDIQQKFKIRDVDSMYKIYEFLIDNISNVSSARKISNAMGSAGKSINHTTVGSYIKYLCNAFAIYEVKRFDIRGKKYLTCSSKYYLVDHSFKYACLGIQNMDYGHTYENIVAVELMRRGYNLYAGFLYNAEIDFVAIKQHEKIYIQVSDNITEETTFNREVKPLLSIKDAHPKILIARTRHDFYTYEGIQVWDIANWLVH